MEKQQAFRRRLVYFAVLAVLYGLIFLALWRTPFFNVSGAHNDRLFSADDVYYVTEFYSAEMDDSARIIKHPLLVVFGCLFTRVEQLVFGTMSLKGHYGLIVCFQMCLSLLSAIYLERILRRQYGLGQRRTLLLCSIYALAFSTLFYTFVAESYIMSALLLIMTFYYTREGKGAAIVLLGVLTAGVTITNAALWAVIVWLGDRGSWKRRLILLALGGAAFCAVTALSPVGRFFFARVLAGGVGSFQNYSDRFGLAELLVRVFFIFFGSTAFYLHTADQSPFGDFPGDALSFLPSASPLVVAASLVWLALLVWAAAKRRRDTLLWAPLGVLAVNLLLHGAAQYGLKEGFLYSLHHLPAQILIVALALKPGEAEKQGRRAEGALWCYLLCEVVLNLPGYLELARFAAG